MPLSLQAGPTAAIADRLERAGDSSMAFDFWLEAFALSRHSDLPWLPLQPGIWMLLPNK